MGRFKMRGGFILNWGNPLSVLFIFAILIAVGAIIWGIIYGIDKNKAPTPPPPTTNDLDITLGSPMPQGCDGGGRIELGCNPSSISINVSLNTSKQSIKLETYRIR